MNHRPLPRAASKVLCLLVITSLAAAGSWPLPGRPVAHAQGNGPTPSAGGEGPEVVELAKLGARISYEAQTGRARFIGLEPGRFIPRAAALPDLASRVDAARSFLGRYGALFGLTDQAHELDVKSERAAAKGRGFVHFQQSHRGIPVLGGELVVQVDSRNNVLSANGELSPGLTFSTTPTIIPAAAGQAALEGAAKWHGVDTATLTNTSPELWVYDPALLGAGDGLPRLVWRVEVMAIDQQPIRELVLIDAQRGNVALHFNQVEGARESQGLASPVRIPTVQTTQTWYVAPGGDDGSDCMTPSTPCASVRAAIEKAASDDEVRVAGGTFTFVGVDYAVAVVDKDLTLSGGWDALFAAQTGRSTLDGQGQRPGIIVNPGVSAVAERFTIRNGYRESVLGGCVQNSGSLTLDDSVVTGCKGGGGIANFGTLTINRGVISDSESPEGSGAGLYNSGTAILSESTVAGNSAPADGATGGGVYSSGTLVLNNSVVHSNRTGGTGGGIFIGAGDATLNNSTVSGNEARSGGGASSYGHLYLYNVTVTNNRALAHGGLAATSGVVFLQNTLVAGNAALSNSPDCIGPSIFSWGYNLIGENSGCSGSFRSSDLVGSSEAPIDPRLRPLRDNGGPTLTHALLPASPAVDAATPTGCLGSQGLLTTDQRGATRAGRCDIGAFEYVALNSQARVYVQDGTPQRMHPFGTFEAPLEVLVLDGQLAPMGDIGVTFSAPAEGAGGLFTDSGTNTTTAFTNADGVASATLRANGVRGSFTVTASAAGLGGQAVFELTNEGWFVAQGGSDLNDCLSPGGACATLNRAIGRAAEGDTIYVASGVYTGTGAEVVLLSKSVALRGGWDSGFLTQGGLSTIDGGGSRRGVTVNGEVTATVERFTVQNGYGNRAGGIFNAGNLTLTESIVKENTAVIENGVFSSGSGGGIFNSAGTLAVSNSTVSGNAAAVDGGGIFNKEGLQALDNVTITGNTAVAQGGGIQDYNGGWTYANGVTITGNYAANGGGSGGGNTVFRNSVLARNWDWGGSSPDCQGSATLNGYNLLGNDTGCSTFYRGPGDVVGTGANPVDPQLSPLQDNGGPTPSHAPRSGSPAIDAGNPVPPGLSFKSCRLTDQRGASRPAGNACDKGAVEGSVTGISFPILATYSAQGFPYLPGTLLCGYGRADCTKGADPHADAAHRHASDTYDFYATYHGRDSLDDAGATIITTVHYGSNQSIAYWDSTQLVLGDAFGFALADDVVAHELTHAVTQYESGLFFYYQSGAINESLSDLWGEFVDLTNGTGNDSLSVRWLIGEDVSGLGAFRNMQNPPAFGHPDRMTSSSYITDESDSGGVHGNSGVNNKAVYLMTDGGTFNGHTVIGLGIAKVAKIYYEAQTHLLTSGSDYADLYDILYQACVNLVGTNGITVYDCQEVRDATDAVEMNKQPVADYNPAAPLCPSGQIPSNLFIDDLESGSGNWNFGAVVPPSRWGLDASYGRYAHSGEHVLYADDYSQAISDSFAEMIDPVPLPTGAYLHFAHAFGFEDPGYDGGVLEYTVNNGVAWSDAGDLFDANGYNGTITTESNNPLGGRDAFVNDSHGYISSRLSLSPLAGHSVRFRWRMGLDQYRFDLGWFLDDVRIYTCGTDTTPPPTCFSLNVLIDPANAGKVALPPVTCSTGTGYSQGSSFALNAVPAHGYHFTGWTGSYTSPSKSLPVTMSSDLTLTAGFEAYPCAFDDVAGSFARDAICEIAAREVMSPATQNSFNTQGIITRETMATFMANAFEAATGAPAPLVSVPFTDIGGLPQETRDDIARIYGLGITTGTTATTYSPSLMITRNQMGVFLARLYKSIHGDDAAVVYVPFTDIYTPGEEWAQSGIARIYGLGITVGTTAATYTPYAFVTREQMALFIVRLLRATGN